MLHIHSKKSISTKTASKEHIQDVLRDYWICQVSREASLLGRREVLTGKAKFGIMGGGKELPQVALAKVFKEGDFRSGYYRDQTWMLALEVTTVEDMFAQLYADPDNDPFSHGRQMNSHFATEFIDKKGEWTTHTEKYNVSADISPTAGQMARALGLALASKKFREVEGLHKKSHLSNHGNEICFCTIGDASTSEGAFWETVNAAGVMQVPLAIFIWDDGYGISVPTKYQTTKGSISSVLSGFQSDKPAEGIDLYQVKGWDYPAMCRLFSQGIEKMRRTHKPAIFHIQELTQPQGHSTSGSHERYKSKDRLVWEQERDCIVTFRNWILENGIADESALEEIEKSARQHTRAAKQTAWKRFRQPNIEAYIMLKEIVQRLESQVEGSDWMNTLKTYVNNIVEPGHYELVKIARRILFYYGDLPIDEMDEIRTWLSGVYKKADQDYHSLVYSEDDYSALKVPVIRASYDENAPEINGYQILNKFFDKKLEEIPEFFAFGEDVGNIGDVNQGFSGLQSKYGEKRVFDTGIREWTIAGQAIGMSMRGLRPIAEMQYLDYLIYALPPISDDLATLRYRSYGQQAAPAIIRTRGHRLEGIWHAGSQLGMILNAVRGIFVCVPRNMVQAAGMYNTLLKAKDPAIVIECLNGYRLKELLPNNVGSYTVPLGIPEVLKTGEDITMVSYGSSLRIAEKAIELLALRDVSIELIDVQTLLPFDSEHQIVSSVAKTNKLVILDEDVPGGASAYMLQKILDEQGAFKYLDIAPEIICAADHRPAYGSEGDYFSKPNVDDVVQRIYTMMHHYNPAGFPIIY